MKQLRVLMLLTNTVAVQVLLPPDPDTVIIYVVVLSSKIILDPFCETEPMFGKIETLVAFEEFQVKVVLPFLEIELGLKNKEQERKFELTDTVTSQLLLPPDPENVPV